MVGVAGDPREVDDLEARVAGRGRPHGRAGHRGGDGLSVDRQAPRLVAERAVVVAQWVTEGRDQFVRLFLGYLLEEQRGGLCAVTACRPEHPRQCDLLLLARDMNHAGGVAHAAPPAVWPAA